MFFSSLFFLVLFQAQEVWQFILCNLFVFEWLLLAAVELFPGSFVGYAIKSHKKYVLQEAVDVVYETKKKKEKFSD